METAGVPIKYNQLLFKPNHSVIPCFLKPNDKCFQLNRLPGQSMRNYIMSLD